MKNDSTKHEKIIFELKKSFGELLENSTQPIYAYLDNIHKFCNEKYALMLGFSSADEWSKVEDPVEETVEEKSREVLVDAYTTAMEEMAASHISVTWKRMDGELIETNVILVPMPYDDELVALHFIEEL